MAYGLAVFNESGITVFDTVRVGFSCIYTAVAPAGQSGSFSVASLANSREICAIGIPEGSNTSGHAIYVDQTNKIITYQAIVLPSIFTNPTSATYIFVFGR